MLCAWLQLAAGLQCSLDAGLLGAGGQGTNCVMQLCRAQMDRAALALVLIGPVALGALAVLGLCGVPAALVRGLARLRRWPGKALPS